MPKYLRQIGTDKAPFIWSEALAARKDMVLHDPDAARIRIASLRAQLRDRGANKGGDIDPEILAKAEKITADAKEIASLEREIEEAEQEDLITAEKQAAEEEGREYKDPEGTKRSDAEIKADRLKKAFDTDDQLNAVKGMSKKVDVRSYLAFEFGLKPGDDVKLAELKDLAITKRQERIVEVM